MFPMISWTILSYYRSDMIKAFDFDLNEKRNKYEINEPLNPLTICNDIEKYYNDRIPYRSLLITAKKYIDEKIETPYKSEIEMKLLKIFNQKKNFEIQTLYNETYDGRIYKCFDQAVYMYNGHALNKDEIDVYDTEISYPIRLTDNKNVIIGQNDWLFLNISNIDYYTGKVNISTTSQLNDVANKYNMLKNLCKKNGKELVIFICPEKEEIYSEYMPDIDIKDKVEQAEKIYNYLKDDNSINYVYPKNEMLKMKKDHLIYGKYDSHWNKVGAYIGINEIKKKLNLEDRDLYNEKLSKISDENYDLVYFGNLSKEAMKKSFDYNFENYKSDYKYNVKTIDGTNGAFISTCDDGFDKNVIIFGDSFISGIYEFVINDFKNVCGLMYTDIEKKFVSERLKASDLVIVLLAERNQDDTFDFIKKCIENYLGE